MTKPRSCSADPSQPGGLQEARPLCPPERAPPVTRRLIVPVLDRRAALDWIARWDIQQLGYLPDREERFTALIDAVEEGTRARSGRPMRSSRHSTGFLRAISRASRRRSIRPRAVASASRLSCSDVASRDALALGRCFPNAA